MLRVFTAIVLCFGLVGCSDDDPRGPGNNETNIDVLKDKIRHVAAECPFLKDGLYCWGDDCIPFQVSYDRDNNLVLNSSWTFDFIADGKVHYEKDDTYTRNTKTLSYCAKNTFHVYINGTDLIVHETYTTTANGNYLIYGSMIQNEKSYNDGEYTFRTY